ncbi:hypothetical protein [Crassaminicella thermophila]|uniref:hypothetical protein n=1 Tax=Crassaminicella thermophila TaxID=2599308 RepID=UPI001A9ABCCF|nr:hypothetical protein [Crassaminicella thermophila]
MYLIVHYFLLRTLVIYNVKSIGFLGVVPMFFDDVCKKTWFLPISKEHKQIQLIVLNV